MLEALTCIEGGEGKRMGSHNVVSEVSLAKPGGMVPLMAPLPTSQLREERRRSVRRWVWGWEAVVLEALTCTEGGEGNGWALTSRSAKCGWQSLMGWCR